MWDSHLERLEKAKRVLVIGGNSGGVELAGELAFGNYEIKKEIEIVTRSSKLLPNFPFEAS